MNDALDSLNYFVLWLNNYKEKHRKLMFDAMSGYNALSVQYHLEQIELADKTFNLIEAFKEGADE